MHRKSIHVSCVCLFLAVFLRPALLPAAGGTSQVASKGRPAYVNDAWPKGVEEIVNDPARTEGWNSWFTEWPNDVNQYAYQIKSTGDLNRLIEKLASVESEVRQIHLSLQQEPRSLGWVTRLDEGNAIPVIFSIGDQSRIDQWYEQVRKPFGQIEFTGAPEAVPPTLTIFVQNPVVDLEELVIPKGITVTRGEVPTVFHRWNTAAEKSLELTEEQKKKLAQLDDNLDPPAKQAAQRIAEFLKRRAGQSPAPN